MGIVFFLVAFLVFGVIAAIFLFPSTGYEKKRERSDRSSDTEED